MDVLVIRHSDVYCLLVEGPEIHKVASFVERTQYAAGYLAALLDVGHPSPRLSLHTRDERMMKKLASAAGIPCARFRSISTIEIGTADANDLAGSPGFRLVLKPANGFGALSTRVVHDEREFTTALADFRFHSNLRSHHLVAEEFVAGDELHIDTLWRDGAPLIFCVSRYFSPVPGTTTADGALYGSVVLHPDDHSGLYADLLDLHVRLSKVIGLREGAGRLLVDFPIQIAAGA